MQSKLTYHNKTPIKNFENEECQNTYRIPFDPKKIYLCISHTQILTLLWPTVNNTSRVRITT